MNTKVLVTGSKGFIGAILIKKLNKDYTVIGHGKPSGNISNSSDFFEVDINSQSNWQACLSDVGTIVHLAAVAHNNSSDLDYINDVNVKGTLNLAKQAAQFGVKRFIFISSIGVLGNTTTGCKPFNENSTVAPHSQYSQSKLDAENGLLKLAKETGLEVVIIRPVLVYGEGAPGNFGKLVNLVKKLPILPFGLVDNKRSFISVDNLVDFIYTCVTHSKAKNEIFCISDGNDVSIKEFTNRIAIGLNKQLWQLPVTNFIFRMLALLTGKHDQIDQLVGDLQVDSSKAHKLLDWHPPVSMAETFSKFKTHK